LPAGDPVKRFLDPPAQWPKGNVEISSKPAKGSIAPAYTSPVIPFLDAEIHGPFFSELSIELQQTQKLVAFDGWGNPRWEMPIGEVFRRDRYSMNAGLMRVAACGHILLVSTGTRIVAIDALVPEGGTPRVLWGQDFEEQERPVSGPRRGRGRFAAGFQRFSFPGDAPPGIAPAAVSEQVVCYQRYHSLQGVDPVTGDILWTREDVQPGSFVFGDNQYIVVAPPDQASEAGQTTATILRAADGKLLGTRPVPAAGDRQTTLGRLVLAWRNAEGVSTLEMIDPWESRPVWPAHKFSGDARMAVLDNEFAGVYEPAGRFVLIALSDGRTVVDAQVLPGAVSDLYLFRSPEQYLVVVNGPEHRGDRVAGYNGVPGVPGVQITRARVYGFDRRGTPLWDKERAPVIQHQYLLTTQPSRLPVLLFACITQERNALGMGQQKLSLVGVDKRTGRPIRPNKPLPATACFRLTGNPEQHTVQVQLQQQVVTMTFTGQPLGPNQEAGRARAGDALADGLKQAAEKAASGTPLGAVLQVIRRIAGDDFDLPQRPLPVAPRKKAPKP
jgi:hypothetical protein